jgi:hypothetical protein
MGSQEQARAANGQWTSGGSEGGGDQKSSADLDSFLNKEVPYFVHKHILLTKSVRQCGATSDAFATVAKANGFDAYVGSVPGHFLNYVQTADGVFKVDLTAIQFEFDHHAAAGGDAAQRAEMGRLMSMVAHDPFRAIKVEKVDHLPADARPAHPENEAMHYTPVDAWRFGSPDMNRHMRGEYDDDELDDRIVKRATGGAPFAGRATGVKVKG